MVFFSFKRTTFILLLFMIFAGSQFAFAQPSDSQVIKDVTGKGTISVKLTPKNGTKQWNGDYGVWEYVRGVNAIREYPQKEGVTIKIVGDAVYQLYGSNYKYWKFRVISNEYLGMGAPSSTELMKIIQADVSKFVSSYWYNRIIGDIKSFYIADDPKFNWHTPNSVSFNAVAEYRALISNTDSEYMIHTYNVRLYRDGENLPWKNFISSSRDKQVSNRQTHTKKELASMKTLGETDRERKAAEALNKLPKMQVANFKSGKDLAMAVNRELRNGTPESVEAFLMQTLSPTFFVSGSTVQLNRLGADVINQSVKRAFKGLSLYKNQYCNNPEIDKRRSSKKRIYLKSIGGRMATQVAFGQFGGGYVDGVKQPGEWKITALNVWVSEKADDIAFFNSFSSPAKACPND